jgi:cell envelope opacity-associated protein A
VVSGWPKGRSLDPHDVSRVRLDEEVHAYHLGRLPTKDRQEMHEAHTVYRVEQNNRWDTRLPATPMESRGVVLGIVEPSRNQVPHSTIIEQERQALVAKSQSLQLTMARLTALQRDLEKKRSEFDEATKEAADIKVYLEEARQERDQAKAQLKQAEALLEDLRENERLRVMSSPQGLSTPKKK